MELTKSEFAINSFAAYFSQGGKLLVILNPQKNKYR
jgi:hypothetical protein